MRIAFADFCPWDFHVQTVDTIPMGGSQSAASYLARALAKQEHKVFFISNLSRPAVYDGVTCLSWQSTSLDQLATMQFDAFICVLNLDHCVELRKKLGPHTRLVLWNHHAANQPGVRGLSDPAQKDAYDGIAMVSHWQRREFLRMFAIDPDRAAVMGNAIPPAFGSQFTDAILPQKDWPPILAYTSTPFRGLDLLLEAFPRIRERVPGTRLQVFSSLKVYQIAQADDEARNGWLYQICRQTQGVEYIGSIPQPQLARALRNVTLLAYPNTFPETSCIAVLEAMASGCRIVTSAMAALPETTSGFARLISVAQSRKAYLTQFIDQVVEVLGECRQRSAECERLLQQQLAHVNSNATYEIRARQWVQWLQSLPTRRGN